MTYSIYLYDKNDNQVSFPVVRNSENETLDSIIENETRIALAYKVVCRIEIRERYSLKLVHAASIGQFHKPDNKPYWVD